MDANAIVDLVNSGDAIDQETIRQAVADIIGTAPENLDTLGEIVETLDAAVLDPNTEGSLANQISVINTTIEDNELTIAAALNDLNSRLLELVTRVDALDGGGVTPVPQNLETIRVSVLTGDAYVLGYVREGVFNMAASSDNPDKAIMFDSDGNVRSYDGPGAEGAMEFLQPIFTAAGIPIESVDLYVSEFSWSNPADMSLYPTIN